MNSNCKKVVVPLRCTLTHLAILATITLVTNESHAQFDGVLGAANRPAEKVHEKIYLASGFGNTFMVLTDEGNVIIDTSLPDMARRHHQVLTEVSKAPTRYIIFTHAHEDHTSGAGLWKQPDTQVIAQRQFVEMRQYQDRFGEFFARRNAAQFGFDEERAREAARNRPARIEPTILFDEKHEFELGGTKFELLHTPGETYDHLTVWLPQYKAAFVGDNFYASFPNMYTLRGCRPRWALDYIDSLNKVLALQPEILLPSHGNPIVGAEKVATAVTRYRDAIQYVHDATVKGMNDGKDVYTLMREIVLPADLDVGDAYGKVSWSVRGIYEGYVGWFDGDPATMYAEAPQKADVELVRMAGGAGPVAKRAMEMVEAGEHVQGLRLAGAALAAEPNSTAATQARAAALKALLAKCRNSNERGWLASGLRRVEKSAAATSGGR
ncbi:MAG TPA: alkyl sulfatase dimerization domain-containing protein [Pirellulales bacterium]|nr:alkyl sulfatase dimerization domain-containing protein [Pirellulales bacterium]